MRAASSAGGRAEARQLSFTREPGGTYTPLLTPAYLMLFVYLPAVFIGFLAAIVCTVRGRRHRDLVLVAWLLIAAQLLGWAILRSIDRSSWV